MRAYPVALAILFAIVLPAAPAQQPAAPSTGDPYAALAGYDFGKDASMLRAIEAEIRTRGASGYAEIERRLLDALARPGASHATKKFVAETLCVVGSPRCIPAARALLKDAKTVHLGCIVLGRLPFKEAEAALIEELAGARGIARVQIVNTLAGARNPGLITTLTQWIGSSADDPALAEAALAALGKAGTPPAAQALADARLASGTLAKARDEALIVAADRLAAEGKCAEARAIFERLFSARPSPIIAVAALRGLVETDKGGALARVLEAMKDPSQPVALAAARLSLQIPGAEATDALCKAFSTAAPAVQVALLRALADRKDAAARPLVVRSLSAGSEEVKAQAALACETLGDRAVVAPLMALARGEGAAAGAARTALARMPVPEVDTTLLGLLDGGDDRAIALATELLVARDSKGAKAKFFAMGKSPDATVRRAAYAGMEAFAGPDDLPALLQTIAQTREPAEKNRLARVLWGATRALGTDDARFEALWAKVEGLDDTVRKVVLPTAAEAGGERSLAIVRTLMKSEDKDLAEAATRTLFAWSNPSAAPAILETIKSSANPAHKTLGARAVVRIVGTMRKGEAPRAVKLLKDTLASLERAEDKAMVQAALAKLGAK